MKKFTSYVIESVSDNGKIFTVEFIKKNGEKRVMNCRKGVKRHPKGGVSTTDHIDNLLTVWDCQNKGYRNINLDTITKIKGNGGIVYNIRKETR